MVLLNSVGVRANKGDSGGVTVLRVHAAMSIKLQHVSQPKHFLVSVR